VTRLFLPLAKEKHYRISKVLFSTGVPLPTATIPKLFGKAKKLAFNPQLPLKSFTIEHLEEVEVPFENIKINGNLHNDETIMNIIGNSSKNLKLVDVRNMEEHMIQSNHFFDHGFAGLFR
jgi:hypothetical protein